MAQKVILAVAGAGKTYHLCHLIDPNKKNIIVAYTHENIHNIRKELCDAYGSVPELTTVMTFHAFLYRHLILPYEPSIGDNFGESEFNSKGICVTTPPSSYDKKRNGNYGYNYQYKVKSKLGHYMDKWGQYYCDTLSELIDTVNKENELHMKKATARLNMFYDTLLIDEFQDFREYDYDVIIKIAEYLNNVVLVGDYYQHSVSGKNNSGRPFKKGKKSVGYDAFISEIKKKGFIVDTTTLEKSRRCSAEVCEFVKQKLGVNIESSGDHVGSVKWVQEDAKEILENDNIVKLVYQKADTYSFEAVNWSYSKGDTVDAACVILTNGLNNLDSDVFDKTNVGEITLNKLYVAMTRTRGDLYLMKESVFKPLHKDYSQAKI